jgi:hypothetical protein
MCIDKASGDSFGRAFSILLIGTGYFGFFKRSVKVIWRQVEGKTLINLTNGKRICIIHGNNSNYKGITRSLAGKTILFADLKQAESLEGSGFAHSSSASEISSGITNVCP